LGTPLPTKLSSLDDRLSDQIEAVMNTLTFTKDGLCGYTSSAQFAAFDIAAEQSLAHLLSLPETQLMTMDEITNIFVQGTKKGKEQASPYHYIPDKFGPVFLDNHNGYWLVYFYSLYCPVGSHDHPIPHIEIFDRVGHFWHVGAGLLNAVTWVGDRWFAVKGNGGFAPATLVAIIRNNGAWQLFSFEHIKNGPNLNWLTTLDPDPQSQYQYSDIGAIAGVVFLDGNRRIHVPLDLANTQFAFIGSPPCEFYGQFLANNAGQIVYHYSGEVYFDWDGSGYVPERDKFTVDLLFHWNSKYTEFLDSRHTATPKELPQGIVPVVVGSWNDYCITF